MTEDGDGGREECHHQPPEVAFRGTAKPVVVVMVVVRSVVMVVVRSVVMSVVTSVVMGDGHGCRDGGRDECRDGRRSWVS